MVLGASRPGPWRRPAASVALTALLCALGLPALGGLPSASAQALALVTLSINSYIAPSCPALAQALSTINEAVAGGKTTKKSFKIALPCTKGSAKGKAWGVPNFHCLGDSPVLFLGKKVTVSISAHTKTCKGGKRPTLGIDTTGEFGSPLLAFGGSTNARVLTVSLKNIVLDGGFVRAGITASDMSALKLSGVDILKTYGPTGQPAALGATDVISLSYVCSNARCKVANATTTNGEPTVSGLPAAGGALSITSTGVQTTSVFTNVDFVGNKHLAYGGAFSILKSYSGPMKVAFKACSFEDNAASACSVGTSGRADAAGATTAGQPLALAFTGSTWTGNMASATAPTSYALVCGLYPTGLAFTKSTVTGLPGSAAGTVHTLGSAALGLVTLPAGFSADYIVVNEQAPAR